MRTTKPHTRFGIALLAVGSLTVVGCSTAGPAAGTMRSSVETPIPSAASVPTVAATAAPDTIASDVPVAVATATRSSGAADVGRRLITVRGVGEVTGTPDTVTIVLGVETRAASASEALASNNTKASAVIAMLKNKGVTSKDLQTSELSITPTYNKETITGYRVTNALTVTLHDMAGAGPIIDAALSTAGDAIRVNQLGFSIGDDSTLRASARADAVRKAKAQAQQMADAAGIGLGSVVSIAESPRNVSPVMASAARMADRAAASMPVEAGSQDLTVTVEMVFAIS